MMFQVYLEAESFWKMMVTQGGKRVGVWVV